MLFQPLLFWIICLFIKNLNANVNILCERCEKKPQCKRLHKKCVYENYLKDNLPLPSSDKVTAKAPETINVSYILFGKTDKRQVAANITWIQTPWRDMNKSGLSWPKQYFLQIQEDNTVTKKLIISSNSDILKEVKQAQFNLLFHEKDFFRLDCDYVFNIMSMPIYHFKSDMKATEVKAHLPGCQDKVISFAKICKNQAKRERKRKNKKKRKKKDLVEPKKKIVNDTTPFKAFPEDAVSSWTPYILIPLASITLLMILILVGLFYKSRISKGIDLSSLLILVDFNQELSAYHHASNLLVSMLGKGPRFNLWKRSKIDDPSLWLREELNNCEHVLLVMTPQRIHVDGKPTCNDFMAYFASMLDRYPSLSKRRIIAIYFDSDSENLPKKLMDKGRVFKLPEQLNGFLKHVTGKSLVEFSSFDEVNNLKTRVNEIRNTKISTTNLVISMNDKDKYP